MSDVDVGDIFVLGLVLAVVILALLVLGSLIFAMMPGTGVPRGESHYTGQVVDVEYQSGVIFKNTIVHMKTGPASSESERFCIAIPQSNGDYAELTDALRNGTRVTVTYSRGFYESPHSCFGNYSMVRDVEHAG